MKTLISMLALLLMGCGEASSTSKVEFTDRNVTNGEFTVIDDNQTIAYPPLSDNNTQIVNIGEGAYYVSCDGGNDCTIQIGDILTDDNSNNSSQDVSSGDSTTTYVDTNSSS